MKNGPVKLASIDIGTNSTRLMIAEKKRNHLKTLYRGVEITRLGAGVNEKRVLSSSAIQRTRLTLNKYKRLIEDYGVNETKVVATSAMRDAKNASLFIDEVEKKVGFQVEVLTGEKEGELSFLGATYDLCHVHQPILVIDIGGGSTEIIFGRPGFAEKFFSLDIGSVRLTEMFIKNDPPLESEIYLIEDYINSIIKGSFKEIDKRENLLCIGLAGTITTLSAISQKMRVYSPKKIHGSRLSLLEIERILNYLLSKNLSERKRLVGLESERADIIIAGTVILREIIRALGLKTVLISEHDILDGLILTMDC